MGSETSRLAGIDNDEIVEWLIGHNPQDRLMALARARGHTMGPWRYVGQSVPGKRFYRHEGCTCTVCGALAAMGHRVGRPGHRKRTTMALWGPALSQACPGAADAGR